MNCSGWSAHWKSQLPGSAEAECVLGVQTCFLGPSESPATTLLLSGLMPRAYWVSAIWLDNARRHAVFGSRTEILEVLLCADCMTSLSLSSLFKNKNNNILYKG